MSAAPHLDGPLWLVGCGNMAGAMLEGWRRAGLDIARVTVIRPSGAPVAGVRVVQDYPLDETPALVMLGVKPQKLDEVAPALAPLLARESALISILAGVRLAALRARFPGPATIVRAMPNTPAALGKAASGLVGEGPDMAKVEALIASLGHAEWIADEDQLDLVGALAGSGPAFLFRFIDALAAAAADLGLPGDQAERIATAMVEGAAALAARSGESPHLLAERVASPGGMTRKGLDVLDGERRLERLVRDTLDAAMRRSREMGAAARTPG